MSETSTAALIPFDRFFRLDAAELKADYRINLFNCVKKENSELLGMFGAEEQEEEEEGNLSEMSENDSELKDGEEPEEIPVKGGKTTKKSRKKMKEMDYDFDDPFIDDSEITDVYQSVFELMRGGDQKESEKEDDAEGKKPSKLGKVSQTNNYFVYRGAMTPEIMAKEFEIEVHEDEEGCGGTGSEKDERDSFDYDGSEGSENSGKDEKQKKKRKMTAAAKKVKEPKKRKVNDSDSAKVKTPKEPKQPKQPKEPKAPKTPKEPKELKPPKGSQKSNDLISQSVKKFNDLYCIEDGTVSVTKPSFNVNGVDANLLELRTVIKRFRDSAVGTCFSPGKFPSALRPCLNETICTILRVCRSTPTVPFPVKMFPALASFLPFSPSALNKLILKKILGPLLETTENSELPKLYGMWKRIVEARVKEEGSIVESSAAVENLNVPDEEVTSASASAPVPASPIKRKLKFNDEMRQQIFEILRTEIDLNNLILLRNNVDPESETKRSVLSDLNLRKIVYQKLVSHTCNLVEAAPLLSTTEISKEFGAQKRKHEKKIAKSAGEIVFGEGQVEEFLKELDARSSTVAGTGNVLDSASNVPVNQDPLNLFTTEAETAEGTVSNTSNNVNTLESLATQNAHDSVNPANTSSLFIDSNQ